CLRDPSGVVEHPDRQVELLAALGMAHEAGDRRVDGERDVVLARELAEPGGEVIVHPEAPLEVDLAGGVAALDEDLDRRFRALLRRHPRRAEVELAHTPQATARPVPERRLCCLRAVRNPYANGCSGLLLERHKSL